MDAIIPHSWLIDYLKTKATPNQIAKYASLSGPSIEALSKVDDDYIYNIEITTNRVDTAGVYGFARELSAILPRYGFASSLKENNINSNFKFSKKVSYLDVKVNSSLCSRFTCVLIKNVKISDSPQIIKERLIKVGLRPINNVVDISNYIMHDLGQPLHTFDYDKIKGSEMILRESKKGEGLTTLDGKKYLLPGGDIVIEDKSGRLIDLAGIMGGNNSAVDLNTKNVLLFVQTYNPLNIRNTCMNLSVRTEAASLFEKNLDPEGVKPAILKSIQMFSDLTKGIPENNILDIYPKPYRPKVVSVDLNFLQKNLGIFISQKEVLGILRSLGFSTEVKGGTFVIGVPSFRSNDIEIPEDIVEEVARIYGYSKLPSTLMTGSFPKANLNTTFSFETKIRNILKSLDGYEVYTLSLVSKKECGLNSLKLKNPLGSDSEYLRSTLKDSLIKASNTNSGWKNKYFLYELSNIYTPRVSNLPQEKMKLGLIFKDYDYRMAKGIIESLLFQLNIDYDIKYLDEGSYFQAGTSSQIFTGKTLIGEFGLLDNDLMFCQLDIQKMQNNSKQFRPYTPIPKYPPQIEDITFILPERTRMGDIIKEAIKSSQLIYKIELVKIYHDSYTFRVWYQHPDKTLDNKEIENIRKILIKKLEAKFALILK